MMMIMTRSSLVVVLEAEDAEVVEVDLARDRVLEVLVGRPPAADGRRRRPAEPALSLLLELNVAVVREFPRLRAVVTLVDEEHRLGGRVLVRDDRARIAHPAARLPELLDERSVLGALVDAVDTVLAVENPIQRGRDFRAGDRGHDVLHEVVRERQARAEAGDEVLLRDDVAAARGDVFDERFRRRVLVCGDFLDRDGRGVGDRSDLEGVLDLVPRRRRLEHAARDDKVAQLRHAPRERVTREDELRTTVLLDEPEDRGLVLRDVRLDESREAAVAAKPLRGRVPRRGEAGREADVLDPVAHGDGAAPAGDERLVLEGDGERGRRRDAVEHVVVLNVVDDDLRRGAPRARQVEARAFAGRHVVHLRGERRTGAGQADGYARLVLGRRDRDLLRRRSRDVLHRTARVRDRELCGARRHCSARRGGPRGGERRRARCGEQEVERLHFV
mmetsp:Transcript_1517/g.4537  ORF Transcript_1517/g.4537 Transcript_1517/m.4537 type:complete len:446 (+) Transcript_1517:85-1422(+)